MRLSQLMLPDIEAAFAADPEAVRELFEDLHDEDVADIVESAPANLAPELLAPELLAPRATRVPGELPAPRGSRDLSINAPSPSDCPS